MKKILMLCLLAAICVSCRAKPVTDEEPVPVYSSEAERFYRNIATKAMGDDYVVYEYVDVRIDDVATLASRYCFETTNGKKAYLRDIYMYKNHKRRATFDCVDLAAE